MTLTLFHVSDLHFGAEDHAALAWFAADVARDLPAAVICTGDVTMRGTVREFAAAAQWLRGLPAPVSVEPGNHDMPYYWELPLRLARPFARFDAFRAACHRPPALAELTVVPLSTVTPAQWRLNWSKGHVRPAAIAAAQAALRAAAGLKLIACHHPLVDADADSGGVMDTGSTRGGAAALAALAAAGADAVLSGHVHDPFDRMVDAGGRPIRLIGAGTLSERLRTTPPSYNRLEWSADTGLRVTVQVQG